MSGWILLHIEVTEIEIDAFKAFIANLSRVFDSFVGVLGGFRVVSQVLIGEPEITDVNAFETLISNLACDGDGLCEVLDGVWVVPQCSIGVSDLRLMPSERLLPISPAMMTACV